jgi:L-ascorbate metabolism protein UlaG (beta-lactamase superfamily)
MLNKTHEHLDHMDTDALPIVAKKSRTHFAGPMECAREFKKMGIPDERRHLLEVGKQVVHDGSQWHNLLVAGELARVASGGH